MRIYKSLCLVKYNEQQYKINQFHTLGNRPCVRANEIFPDDLKKCMSFKFDAFLSIASNSIFIILYWIFYDGSLYFYKAIYLTK